MTPYFSARGPPAFSATLPPSVHHSQELGSGGQKSPTASAAFMKSPVTTPGSATAVRSSTRRRLMDFIRSRLSTTPPSSGSEPPLLPDRAPHGVTGTPWAWVVRRTWLTCAVVSASTTTSAGSVPKSDSSRP